MMNRHIQAVIFDMDGLMFDTELLYQKAWQQAGAEMGLEVTEPFLATLRGGNYQQVKNRFLEQFGQDLDFDSLRNRRTALFDEELDRHGVPVKKGLRELLDYLRQNRCPMAVASASARNVVSHHLKETGLTDYFSVIITGDMVTACKPDPEVFYKAAEQLGCRPEHCIVLEDSINGIRAAWAGGFLPVMVPDLTQPDETLSQLLWAKCDSLLDVIPLLEQTEDPSTYNRGRKPCE